MKKKYFALIILFVSVFIPFQMAAQETQVFRQEGIASWYGREFEGRPTASGEIFDSSQLTAAHPTLPFGTMLVVTNQHNNKSVMVRVNDRGPFVPMRIIDVSRAAAEQLDMIVTGTAPVTVQSIDRIIISTAAVGAQIEPQSVILPSDASRETPLNDANAAALIELQIRDQESGSAVQALPQLRLTPQLNIVSEKNYRFQVGSFSNARNAVDAFDRLKAAGLNPAYERFVNDNNVQFYRVVVAGVSGISVQSTSERIYAAGFSEALIREEH